MSSPTEQLLDWLLAPPSRVFPATLGPADWDDLLAESVAHTVAPQFFQRLLAASPSVPAAVLQCAMVATARQKQHVAGLRTQLATVLHALAAKGITAILLKGAHLATIVYPDPSHRPMADIDLLVQPSELEAANQVLVGLGYAPQFDEPINVTRAHNHALPLMLKEGCIPIETHWTLADPGDGVQADIDGIWQRSISVDVNGAPARAFCAEDLLLHICLHAGVMHNFAEKGLRPLFDVLAILARHGTTLDWKAVESRAREWHVERSVWLMLELVRESSAAAIPEDVLKNLKPARVSRAVVSAARGQMFERPGTRFETIRPRQVALALNQPGLLWKHLRHGTGRRMKDLLSRYGGFLWNGLRRNRHLLGFVLRRTRRQFILNAWLKRRTAD